jgi:diguanylate cyclase (GGDEF)-like protein
MMANYSVEESVALAERIRKDIEQSPVNKKHGVTASFGIASLPDQASNEDALVAYADKALYEAKGAGRNCVRVSQETAS